ncbi:glycerophosphodiester phosphodiesterase [Streptomyces violaceorubidus]
MRLTADGHLVCVHDWRVNRTSNGRGAVSALELADLAALDFGVRRTREFWRTRDEQPDWEHRPEDREETSVLTLERLLQLVADAGRRVELAMRPSTPRAGRGRWRSGCCCS